MNEIQRFIVFGTFCGISPGDKRECIAETLGEASHYEPPYKRRPEYILYGDLEFRLSQNEIMHIGLATGRDIVTTQSVEQRIGKSYLSTVSDVQALLALHSVEYEYDSILSDSSQTVLVTSRAVHLAFDQDNSLTRVAGVKTRVVN